MYLHDHAAVCLLQLTKQRWQQGGLSSTYLANYSKQGALGHGKIYPIDKKISLLSPFRYTFWKENGQNSCYCLVAIKMYQLNPLNSYLRPQLHSITLPVMLTFCSRSHSSKETFNQKVFIHILIWVSNPDPHSGDRLAQSTGYKTFLNVRTFQHCFFSKTAMPFEISM